jgi:lycopene beta-cyclase
MSLHHQPSSKPSGEPRAAGFGRVVLVGAGLQNSLIALALLDRDPDAEIVLLEKEPSSARNHTWSCHASDIPADVWNWFEPLVCARWPAYDVRFASYSRRIEGEYLALSSARVEAVLSERLAHAPNARLITNAPVADVGANSVTLEDGTRIDADLVVDSRGPERAAMAVLGYQKFVGLELELSGGTAPVLPTLMDATVAQRDGYRFLYVLPLGPHRILYEDTYYSETPDLDEAEITAGLLKMAAIAGLKVKQVLRRERGVLPLPSRPPKLTRPVSPLLGGYAGGLFHPTTGYSLPVALRLARALVRCDGDATELERTLADVAQQQRFACWLNRLLFRAFAPRDRHRVLERFYRLPEGTIARFYALESTSLDRARIICGKPPKGFSATGLWQVRSAA